jgi:penicillin-binding protein 2
VDNIVKVAQEFGLGSKTGIRDLTGEAEGLLPTPDWKRDLNSTILKARYESRREKLDQEWNSRLAGISDPLERTKVKQQKDQALKLLEAQYKIDYNFYTSWQPFDTFNMSIGQGSNNFTVIQLANYVSTLANGGKRWRPYLVDSIETQEGKVLMQFEPELVHQVNLDPAIMAHLRRGMRAVTEPGGTSYRLFSDIPPEMAVAGKTGTAQTGRSGDDKRKDFHGVFIGFAPYDKPEIAVAVIIEYGESGGGSAAIVAHSVFKEYFGLNEEEADTQ